MYSSDELLRVVNRAIDALPLERQPEGLYAPIRYVLSLGGKRLRPVLLLMAYNLYREDVAPAVDAAVALETYHNFTLLHDDLMDRAEVRRGKPCVHRKWGDTAAVLSGDHMLALAFERMARCASPAAHEALLLLAATAREVDEGQQLDMDFERRGDVGEDEYIEMIRLKTSVLLACAASCGALLAGAPGEDREALYRFGERLGLAFQLQDDYLDIYGDYKTFGKRIGGDIRCNKKTYMLINALRLADAERRAELQRWLDVSPGEGGEEKVGAVTALYTRLGVDKLALRRIEEHFREAAEALDGVRLPRERKERLAAYAARLLGRQS